MRRPVDKESVLEVDGARHCPSYPGYSVTSNGRVFTHRKKVSGHRIGSTVVITAHAVRELKHRRGAGTYPAVNIVVPGKGIRSIPVHRLILDAFVGPHQPGMHCRHLDGNRQNCTLANLTYGTPAENAADRYGTATDQRGEGNPKAKLTWKDVGEIRRRASAGETGSALAREFGITQPNASAIILGKTWKEQRNAS